MSHCQHAFMWELPKLGDPDIGVLIIRILLSLGYYIRVPLFLETLM